MHIRVQREELLKPLALVANVIDRRQAQQPILGHVLLHTDQSLEITGTDLEVELKTRVGNMKVLAEGSITVPGRKLFDIIRALPALAEIELKQDGERMVIKARSSRFTLATLPARDYPNIEMAAWDTEMEWAPEVLRRLLEKTHFCMAQQDARYFLNGLLFDVAETGIRVVATDGHRLAVAEQALEAPGAPRQVIVPRKGVLEMMRLLGEGAKTVAVALSSNHVRVQAAESVLISKLIDGRFPDYEKVIPEKHKMIARVPRAELRESLARVAILASEKYRGVRLALTPGLLTLTAQNPEQEEAREELKIDYAGDDIEVGFNVGYLGDAVAALDGDEIELGLSDANSSTTLRAAASEGLFYIIMPMRL